jgi:hypothetical protein
LEPDLPKQGIDLDAVAIRDVSTHDGQPFFPHVEKVFACYPELAGSVERVLYDSACDDGELKTRFHDELGVELKASLRVMNWTTKASAMTAANSSMKRRETRQGHPHV